MGQKCKKEQPFKPMEHKWINYILPLYHKKFAVLKDSGISSVPLSKQNTVAKQSANQWGYMIRRETFECPWVNCTYFISADSKGKIKGNNTL